MMPCGCLMAVLPWTSPWPTCVNESSKSLENKKVWMRPWKMRLLGLDFIRSASLFFRGFEEKERWKA